MTTATMTTATNVDHGDDGGRHSITSEHGYFKSDAVRRASIPRCLLLRHYAPCSPARPRPAVPTVHITRIQRSLHRTDPPAIANRPHHRPGRPVARPMGRWNFQWHRIFTVS